MILRDSRAVCGYKSRRRVPGSPLGGGATTGVGRCDQGLVYLRGIMKVTQGASYYLAHILLAFNISLIQVDLGLE